MFILNNVYYTWIIFNSINSYDRTQPNPKEFLYFVHEIIVHESLPYLVVHIKEWTFNIDVLLFYIIRLTAPVYVKCC